MLRRDFLQGALVLLGLNWAALAATSYTLLNTRFNCSLPLSQPTKLGLDAASRSYPAGADKPQWEVIVVEIGKQAFAEMQGAGMSPQEYARTTYLGQSGAAPGKGSRKFTQGVLTSEIDPQSFPHKDHLETFWLERKEGAGLLLAFRRSPAMNKELAERAANEICASLEWRL
jgi:hypothetical protein